MGGLRLLVIGKQGSGKGTLSAKLAQHFSIPHISTGDILRSAVQNKTPLGAKTKSYLDRGELVPDTLIMELIDTLFAKEDLKNKGFVFDGFPRTVTQADLLDELLGPDGIDAVINLEVPTDVAVKRISSRRVCSNGDCGAIYSVSNPPKVNWTCDLCGSPVVQRSDDKEEAVLKRLGDYEQLTAPLIGRYEKLGKLFTIDGVGSPDEVFDATRKVLEPIAASRSLQAK